MSGPFPPQPVQANSCHLYIGWIVIFALLSGMAATIPLQAQGEPAESPVWLARTPQEYSRLLQMDAGPEIPPLVEAHPRAKHHPKLPERYDVNKIGARHVGNGVNFYSLDKEVAMGREM